MEKFWILWEYLKLRWYRKARYHRPYMERIRNQRAKSWRKRLAKSPFYVSYQQAPLEEFPVVNKALFMENFDAINVAGITKEEAFRVALQAEESRDFSPTIGDITVGLSSGTSGNKGIFLANGYERAQWVATVLDRIIGWSWKHRKVAFFLRANSNLYESVKSRLLTFEFFDILQPLKGHAVRLARYQPDILVAQPSVLRDVVLEMKKQGITPSVSRVISVAEVLDPEDQNQFSDFFGVRVEQVYQCTEGFLAHTCEEGNLHFNEDWLMIERNYLDEKKDRFHPVITDYFRRTQPVIRYELNDIIHPGPPCACGLASQTIARIEGRADDVFRLSNTAGEVFTIYPDFLRRAVIGASDSITDYRVTQVSERRITYYLEVEGGSDLDLVQVQVEKALRRLFDRLALDFVDIVYTTEIARIPGAKRIRIHNAHRPTV